MTSSHFGCEQTDKYSTYIYTHIHIILKCCSLSQNALLSQRCGLTWNVWVKCGSVKITFPFMTCVCARDGRLERSERSAHSCVGADESGRLTASENHLSCTTSKGIPGQIINVETFRVILAQQGTFSSSSSLFLFVFFLQLLGWSCRDSRCSDIFHFYE